MKLRMRVDLLYKELQDEGYLHPYMNLEYFKERYNRDDLELIYNLYNRARKVNKIIPAMAELQSSKVNAILQEVFDDRNYTTILEKIK
jgi:hypothetical protein